MRTLKVTPNGKEYQIIIGNNILSQIGDYIKCSGGKVFIITDDNVAKHYLNTVEKSLKEKGYTVSSLILEHGEATKNYNSLLPIYEKMIEFNLTRKDLVITLGGGVIGDLGGFAASTYLRGVDFVQVPTSLLAQVDSSVGGKVAVDIKEGKNLIGSFYQPKLVFTDLDCLNTLSDYFYKDGMAEIIKYGAIKDKNLFKKLESIKSREEFMKNAEDIVYTCCDIKREVVENDEFDMGERMLLNFGHTYGHAIEKYFNYEKYSHGQAVAIGMCFITQISEKLGLTKKGVFDRLQALCNQYGLDTSCEVSAYNLINAVKVDKKNMGKDLMLVLIKDIGESFIYKSTSEFFLK